MPFGIDHNFSIILESGEFGGGQFSRTSTKFSRNHVEVFADKYELEHWLAAQLHPDTYEEANERQKCWCKHLNLV